jgi:DNA adenine methylase
MGSKNRHSKELLPIILSYHKEGYKYVEPFVGGANVLDKIPSHIERVGYDIHPYLIAMWRAVSSGWMPPEQITEEEYQQIKQNKGDYQPELIGYTGFALSFGAMWFSSYRRDNTGRRNYSSESYRGAVKQFPKLLGVEFYCESVFNLNFTNSTIYCDPPYKDTASYSVGDFCHEQFYDWCRKQRDNGCTVLVSEYNMPDDFLCVWQKQVNSSLAKDTGSKKAVEKLFILK